jgi:hypothetical protein
MNLLEGSGCKDEDGVGLAWDDIYRLFNGVEAVIKKRLGIWPSSI